jgi:hypothetical protein
MDLPDCINTYFSQNAKLLKSAGLEIKWRASHKHCKSFDLGQAFFALAYAMKDAVVLNAFHRKTEHKSAKKWNLRRIMQIKRRILRNRGMRFLRLFAKGDSLAFAKSPFAGCFSC